MYAVASSRATSWHGWRPTIHAHKFAFEGLAYLLAVALDRAPLVCSIRGEVEEKVFRCRITRVYRRVAPLPAAVLRLGRSALKCAGASAPGRRRNGCYPIS
jgi:hypothetical protein